MNVLRKDFWKTKQIECLTVWVWNVRRRYGFLITFLLWSWEIKRLEFSSGWMRKLEIGLYLNVPECYKVKHSKIEWLEGEKKTTYSFLLDWICFSWWSQGRWGGLQALDHFQLLDVRAACCTLVTLVLGSQRQVVSWASLVNQFILLVRSWWMRTVSKG